MPRDFPRTRRIGEQIQRELAGLIQEEMKDPRLAMVTVSAVHVNRDLSVAKVFVTVFSKDGETQESVQVLNRAAGFLRHGLAERMILRNVPRLQFVYDESIERGARLSDIIDTAVGNKRK